MKSVTRKPYESPRNKNTTSTQSSRADLLKPIFMGALKKYRPVEAENVAEFMVKVAHEEPIAGVYVYELNVIE